LLVTASTVVFSYDDCHARAGHRLTKKLFRQ